MGIICVVENDIIHHLVVTGQKLIISIMMVIMNVHAHCSTSGQLGQDLSVQIVYGRASLDDIF